MPPYAKRPTLRRYRNHLQAFFTSCYLALIAPHCLRSLSYSSA